jgi:hypothetical protein
MTLEFAWDFIAIRESMEQKQSRLNAACAAWSIANLPKHERRKALVGYLRSCRAQNPAMQDASFLRKDMEHLIKQINRLFSQIKKPIMHTEIRGDGDRFSISTVSMRTE